MFLSSTIFLLKNSQVVGQTGGESETETETKSKKQDIFKVILTVDGLGKDSGDLIAFVTVNGQSKAKLFDDTSTFGSVKKGTKTGLWRAIP